MVGRAPCSDRDRTPAVRVVRFRPAAAALRADGLDGWLVVEVGPLRIDGIALRRTQTGRFTLSFPKRTDLADREHAIVRPADDAARVAIERAVFEQLELDEDPAP